MVGTVFNEVPIRSVPSVLFVKKKNNLIIRVKSYTLMWISGFDRQLV